MSIIDWRVALQNELAPLLDSLARGEGATPALRYRIEGFARAISGLGLAPAEEVIDSVRASYAQALGDAASAYGASDFSSGEAGAKLPCVPLRVPRAPVVSGRSS